MSNQGHVSSTVFNKLRYEGSLDAFPTADPLFPPLVGKLHMTDHVLGHVVTISTKFDFCLKVSTFSFEKLRRVSDANQPIQIK
jgi:hypothetical protein